MAQIPIRPLFVHMGVCVYSVSVFVRNMESFKMKYLTPASFDVYCREQASVNFL